MYILFLPPVTIENIFVLYPRYSLHFFRSILDCIPSHSSRNPFFNYSSSLLQYRKSFSLPLSWTILISIKIFLLKLFILQETSPLTPKSSAVTDPFSLSFYSKLLKSLLLPEPFFPCSPQNLFYQDSNDLHVASFRYQLSDVIVPILSAIFNTVVQSSLLQTCSSFCLQGVTFGSYFPSLAAPSESHQLASLMFHIYEHQNVSELRPQVSQPWEFLSNFI